MVIPPDWSSFRHYGRMSLVRMFTVLSITSSACFGLPLLSMTWLRLASPNPRIDEVFEATIRYHNLVSSCALYASLIYCVVDVAIEARTKKSIISLARRTFGYLSVHYSTDGLIDRLHWARSPYSSPLRELGSYIYRAATSSRANHKHAAEVELEYYQTTIYFLVDALDEVITAKDKSYEGNIGLQRRIDEAVAEREGRDREVAELRQQIATLNEVVATKERADQDNLELKHLISAQNDGIRVLEAELRLHRAGQERSESDSDSRDHSNPGSRLQLTQERPLQEWRSHTKMFLTARIKPCADANPDLGHEICSVENDANRHPCIVLRDPESDIKTWHPFDHCFAPRDTNDRVWEEYRDFLLGGLFDNHTVAVVTDGPSGSGKTYTMFKGRDALISTAIYNILQHETNGGRSVQIRAVEVYRNGAADMVAKIKSGKSDRLEGGQKSLRRKTILWRDYQAYEVSSSSTSEHIQQKILAINNGRINKDTVMNTSRSPLRGGSSRGHLVLIVNRVGIVGDHEGNDIGKLVFVDLAGTEERGANDGDIDAEYDDIRKDRSECYAFFRTMGKSMPAHGDRALIRLLKSLLPRPNVVERSTKIAHILHFSTTDHQRNMWLIAQKKELEHTGATTSAT